MTNNQEQENFCTFNFNNGEVVTMTKEKYFDFLSKLDNNDLLKLMKGKLNKI